MKDCREEKKLFWSQWPGTANTHGKSGMTCRTRCPAEAGSAGLQKLRRTICLVMCGSASLPSRVLTWAEPMRWKGYKSSTGFSPWVPPRALC